MIAFLLLFLSITVVGIRFIRKGFNEYNLSKQSTDAIKGIFIVIVFINHIKEYYVQVGTNLTVWYDTAFFLPAQALGQLMVVMFLFYSGYGVAESIKKKGKTYVNAIPKRRVLGTLVNFDVAVIIFAITCLLLGLQVDIFNFFLSLIGWGALGNSNWYIFCIIVCYALTFFSYTVNQDKGWVILFLLLFAYITILSFYKGTWWYNTVLAYGAGVFLSEHKEWFTQHWANNYAKWMVVMLAGFLASLGCYLLFYSPFKTNLEFIGAIVFNVMSVFFAFLVVIMTMKVTIPNNMLVWLGKNLFPLYIYQRLPMMVLSTLFPVVLVVNHPYIFLALCIAITGSIAWGYKYIQVKLI